MNHAPTPPAALPTGRVFLTSHSGAALQLGPLFTFTADVLPVSNPQLAVRGRPGAILVGAPQVGVRTGSISGELHPSNVDELMQVLMNSPVQVRLGSAVGRFLSVHFTSVTRDEVNERTTRITATFEALTPYWRAHAPTVSSGSLARNATRVVTVGGNVPVRPVVRITGASGGTVAPRLFNHTNGTSLQYMESLASGNLLEIDAAELTAWRSAVPVIGSMDDAFALGFELSPGENSIQLLTTSGNANVVIEWHDQFA